MFFSNDEITASWTSVNDLPKKPKRHFWILPSSSWSEKDYNSIMVSSQDALAAPSGKQSQNVNGAFQTLRIEMCLKGLVNSQNKVIFFSPPALS